MRLLVRKVTVSWACLGRESSGRCPYQRRLDAGPMPIGRVDLSWSLRLIASKSGHPPFARGLLRFFGGGCIQWGIAMEPCRYPRWRPEALALRSQKWIFLV